MQRFNPELPADVELELKNSEWAMVWLGMFYAKLHLLFQFKSTTSRHTQAGVLRCVNELIIAYEHLQALGGSSTPVKELETDLKALRDLLATTEDKNTILKLAQEKLTELASKYAITLLDSSSLHENSIALNNFAEILRNHLTCNDLLENIKGGEMQKLQDNFPAIKSLIHGPILTLVTHAMGSERYTKLTITPSPALELEEKEKTPRSISKLPKAARLLGIDASDWDDTQEDVFALRAILVPADRCWLNSLPDLLPHLPREVDDEIEEIVRKLQATKRNKDLSKKELDDAIDNAREKITWLIILNDKNNRNISYAKMIYWGALAVLALATILALTGAVTIPVIAGSAALSALVYVFAPPIVGGLCGAAVKKIAAYTHSYRFGIFKEPLVMHDAKIAGTILARSPSLNS